MKTPVLLCASVAVAVVAGVALDRQPKLASGRAEPVAETTSVPPLRSEGAIQGRVLEAFDVAQYTYLRLSGAEGEIWAAVSKAKVAVGSRIEVVDAARMTNFHSATLKRTFPVIYFGSIGGGVDHAAAERLPPGHPAIGHQDSVAALAAAHAGGAVPHAASAEAIPADIKVARATGANARSIAELFAERQTLNDKSIRVRGRIVKATPVQGITYYRLRDGSSTEPESSELVVSSTATLAAGEVATFEGTAGTDVDVGIGVKYAVLLREARVVTP
jgi:hypothetical protein